MGWKQRQQLSAAPTLPCSCIDLARKDAIHTVRSKVLDSMWTANPVKSDEQWRDLMLDLINDMRGL